MSSRLLVAVVAIFGCACGAPSMTDAGLDGGVDAGLRMDAGMMDAGSDVVDASGLAFGAI